MVDNVGTDLLQNFNLVNKNHFEEMNIMIRGFTELVFYFNSLVDKYYSLFGSSIGEIYVTINAKMVHSFESFMPGDIIKYRY